MQMLPRAIINNTLPRITGKPKPSPKDPMDHDEGPEQRAMTAIMIDSAMLELDDMVLNQNSNDLSAVHKKLTAAISTKNPFKIADVISTSETGPTIATAVLSLYITA
jgi:hypothetical protein